MYLSYWGQPLFISISKCVVVNVTLEFSVSPYSPLSQSAIHHQKKFPPSLLAQIEWPCISRVHDKIFVKFGHPIACRDAKHLKNSNDIDTTANDLEMTFNVSDTWSKLLPPYYTIMEINPPTILAIIL